ncbi:MAG TPA: hypothetical protein VGB08_08225 [Allosphingosinicella sp.]|jgi:hypothetical protein
MFVPPSVEAESPCRLQRAAPMSDIGQALFACGHRQEAQATGAIVAKTSRLASIMPRVKVKVSIFAIVLFPLKK